MHSKGKLGGIFDGILAAIILENLVNFGGFRGSYHEEKSKEGINYEKKNRETNQPRADILKNKGKSINQHSEKFLEEFPEEFLMNT